MADNPKFRLGWPRFSLRLRDLSTRTKISLIVLLLLVPIGYTVWLITTDRQVMIAASERELEGIAYIGTVRPAIFAVSVENKAQDIAGAVEVARNAQKQLRETKERGALADEFAFTAQMSAANGSDGAAAIEKAATLLSQVAEESNLSLDPELTSFYLGTVIVSQLPSVIGEFVAERDVAAAAIVADELSTEQRVGLLTLSVRQKADLDSMRASFTAAFRNDKQASEQVAGVLTAFVKAADGFALSLDEGLIDRDGRKIDGQRIKQNYAAALAAAGELWTQTAKHLDRVVAARIARLKRTLTITLFIVGGIVLTSLVLGFVMQRQIVGPLGRLERLAHDVRTSDDYSLRIDYAGHDEVGRLATAFNGMLAEVADGR